ARRGTRRPAMAGRSPRRAQGDGPRPGARRVPARQRRQPVPPPLSARPTPNPDTRPGPLGGAVGFTEDRTDLRGATLHARPPPRPVAARCRSPSGGLAEAPRRDVRLRAVHVLESSSLLG